MGPVDTAYNPLGLSRGKASAPLSQPLPRSSGFLSNPPPRLGGPSPGPSVFIFKDWSLNSKGLFREELTSQGAQNPARNPKLNRVECVGARQQAWPMGRKQGELLSPQGDNLLPSDTCVAQDPLTSGAGGDGQPPAEVFHLRATSSLPKCECSINMSLELKNN